MVFFLRQLQEKCKERKQPLFVAFIALMKAFDLIDSILAESPDSSPDEEHAVTMSEATEQEERPRVQAPTDTKESGVKADEYLRYGKVQRSLNQPEIPQTLEVDTPRVIADPGCSIIRNVGRPDGGRANAIFGVQAALLKAKSKVQLRCLHDFLFADDTAVTALSAEDLQKLLTCFSKACQAFELTISLKKTQVMGQGVDSPPNINISDYKLEFVHDFMYLGSTI
ncbi:uncharacterized protein [Procambarus clarkii]|uniref:uncharacterized protein n=1 Tax=Procambarus clarkii TaxID=6728 RepID=UPI0037421E18